jgi:hypothetical protein
MQLIATEADDLPLQRTIDRRPTDLESLRYFGRAKALSFQLPNLYGINRGGRPL